jgi:hypothetical protein
VHQHDDNRTQYPATYVGNFAHRRNKRQSMITEHPLRPVAWSAFWPYDRMIVPVCRELVYKMATEDIHRHTMQCDRRGIHPNCMKIDALWHTISCLCYNSQSAVNLVSPVDRGHLQRASWSTRLFPTCPRWSYPRCCSSAECLR